MYCFLNCITAFKMSRYNYTEYETTLHRRSKILLILHETLVWPYMTHTFGV